MILEMKILGPLMDIDKNELKKIKNFKTERYETYKEILMKNLVPNSADDLTVNKSLLLENNFDNLNAIDWDKGCYVGQEITARMKYRALLKKQLYSLEIVKGEININDDIVLDEINYGKVISKSNQYILCMLKIELVEKALNNKENFEINNSIILKIL
jgi:folate-binding protein YgfZ